MKSNEIAELIASADTLEVVQNTIRKNGKPPKSFVIHTIYLFKKKKEQRAQIVIPARMTWAQACELHPRLASLTVGIMPPFDFHFDKYIQGEAGEEPTIQYNAY
jgi:predicted cupin superfamily sugar epimerase